MSRNSTHEPDYLLREAFCFAAAPTCVAFAGFAIAAGLTPTGQPFRGMSCVRCGTVIALTIALLGLPTFVMACRGA